MTHVDILMYHSIAEGPGPLSIPPSTFRMQLDEIAARGLRGVSLREYVRAETPTRRSSMAVLTFDDGYKDFSDVAAPEILARGWSCTVFLATDLVASANGWDADGSGRRRPLIDWSDAAALASRGVEIGSHSVTHADLTQLGPAVLHRELTASREAIETRARCQVTSFAAPYGRTTSAVRKEIAKTYECAVGTRLGAAREDSDIYDLPRIEMWYFRDRARWRAYLNGATGYLTLRQVLRTVRARAGLGT